MFQSTRKNYFKTIRKINLKCDTQKSFDYFIQCKDNYKVWQTFDIFLNGTIMELIKIYCAETGDILTPYVFLE